MNDRPIDLKSDDAALRTERFACDAARLISDSKCEEVMVLNLRGLSPMTDFFILASGTSERQIRSIADDLRLLARKRGDAPAAVDAGGSGGWVVADFFDVVVHLFMPEVRAYYDLESLWSDAKTVDWENCTEPGKFANLRAQAD